MERVVPRAVLLMLLAAGACLSPLYEDGAPLTASWVICCRDGIIDTCLCADATTCQSDVYPCAGGRCSRVPWCGDSLDAGAPVGGGAGGGDGAAPDAGAFGQDAGVSFGGGTGGGTGGGGGGSAFPTGHAFCCRNERVTTCECPASGCVSEAFTSCGGGSCLQGIASACP